MYEDEIILYLGSTVYMEVVCLPQVINYWNMEEEFYYPFMAKRISRDRFLHISKYLHIQVSDSANDKLHKVILI